MQKNSNNDMEIAAGNRDNKSISLGPAEHHVFENGHRTVVLGP